MSEIPGKPEPKRSRRNASSKTLTPQQAKKVALEEQKKNAAKRGVGKPTPPKKVWHEVIVTSSGEIRKFSGGKWAELKPNKRTTVPYGTISRGTDPNVEVAVKRDAPKQYIRPKPIQYVGTIDPDRALSAIEDYFATVTNEELYDDLQKAAPELIEHFGIKRT